MQKDNKRVLAYSAMTSAFLAMITDTEAQVVYTDIDPDTTLTEHEDYYEVDFNGDGKSEVTLRKQSFTSSYIYPASSIDYNIYLRYLRLSAIPHINNSLIGEVGYYGLPMAYALDEGNLIDEKQNWQDDKFQFLGFSLYINISTKSVFSYGFTYFQSGYWLEDGADKFLGIRFQVGNNKHYGWVRMQTNEDNSDLTIKDFAYNSAEKIFLTAGQMTGGDAIENNLDEKIINMYSYGKNMHLVLSGQLYAKAELFIYNTTGQLVMTKELNGKSEIISLSNHAEGIYTFQIISDQGNYVKQLSIY